MNTIETQIGIIGTGNMGTAIISGLTKVISSDQITIYDSMTEKMSQLKGKYSIKTAEFLDEIVESSEYIFLAVKPAQIHEIIEHMKDFKGTIISIAAGITIKSIENIAGFDKKIVRAMPNTPALVGEGMTSISSNPNVTDEELEQVSSMFACIGKVVIINEKLMDAVTGVSGSGPAYVYSFIQAMADGAVKMGLSREDALLLASQTVMGSARMVLETGENPIALRDNVTSPGGTTIDAVHVLEKSGFSGFIIDAIEEATNKSKKLGE